MKKIESIIRTLIREMALGGIQIRTGDTPPPSRAPLHAGGPMVTYSPKPAQFKKYYESGLFTKRAESYFRDEHWPYPVYLFPYVGLISKDVDPRIANLKGYNENSMETSSLARFSELFGTQRVSVMSMDEGEPYLEKLGFDSQMIQDRSGFALVFTSASTNPRLLGTLWMVMHSIFDSSPNELMELSPTYAKLMSGDNPLVLDDFDYDRPRLATAFTMNSTQINQIGTPEDCLAEVMSQELVQRHKGGFVFKDVVAPPHSEELPQDEFGNIDAEAYVPLSDEERSILEGLKETIVVAADEFIQNCRGKMLFVRTT